MKRDEFIKAVGDLVRTYIECHDRYDSDPQLRVNPSTLNVGLINGREMQAEIDDANATIDAAAGAEGAMEEESADFQVTQTPDFYPIKQLVVATPGSTVAPDANAIISIANIYFRK